VRYTSIPQSNCCTFISSGICYIFHIFPVCILDIT
jgi:hypothetical protein